MKCILILLETVYLSVLQGGSLRRGTELLVPREYIYGTTYQGMSIFILTQMSKQNVYFKYNI